MQAQEFSIIRNPRTYVWKIHPVLGKLPPRIAQPNAFGSKVTINLSYDLFNHKEPNAFSVDMALEDRRALGTAMPPLQAGIGAGSIVPTGATWGQFDIGITQLYIRQSQRRNRFQYTIGKIFAPNYGHPYPFFDDNRQFLSQQFSTGTTCNCPLRASEASSNRRPLPCHGDVIGSRC
jgi:hypothetical protein